MFVSLSNKLSTNLSLEMQTLIVSYFLLAMYLLVGKEYN